MRLFFKIMAPILGAALVIALFSGQYFAGGLFQRPVLVIDPGHGGVDGGAVSKHDISEKNINLRIAMKLRDIAEANGWKVVMTRDEDECLGESEPTVRSQKVRDLSMRKEIIDEAHAVAAVSIHLNSFPQDPSCRGAQTFYPKEQEESVREQSRLLAETIQASLSEGLGGKQERLAAEKSKVYIFKHPTPPIALVECGFLSNADEEYLLQDEQYQYELAVCMFKGLENFYRQINGKNLSSNPENLIISDENIPSPEDFSQSE